MEVRVNMLWRDSRTWELRKFNLIIIVWVRRARLENNYAVGVYRVMFSYTAPQTLLPSKGFRISNEFHCSEELLSFSAELFDTLLICTLRLSDESSLKALQWRVWARAALWGNSNEHIRGPRKDRSGGLILAKKTTNQNKFGSISAQFQASSEAWLVRRPEGSRIIYRGVTI